MPLITVSLADHTFFRGIDTHPYRLLLYIGRAGLANLSVLQSNRVIAGVKDGNSGEDGRPGGSSVNVGPQ